ncbi:MULTISPECIES: phage terminase small subunit P27 family [Acinetobacter calcoaceticus/baumannii complex]|uniref:phage terminase small subunit P27 family n=1 Tax=Acinetobacter calcoaceticus/baumannii complex TaxID=909768 RepID=UPI0024DEDA6A|nr:MULTISPECIES: phage terminase small subunit P27 family [Acinetobacter calcoaceticus/baumannii complex]MDO7353908.1 phage terminase small subunit P27 family [Acinetobacter baumannii]MDR0066287.1 phage terminase small subunit P27 family [Acinetobacter sp. 11520]MDO7403830.1 phage terminase small subunit P27 family [Acinetobacter baumannii]MDQ9029250.1 phage terminase small subunit P27 family [Acinetobacter nosocomialis]MDQ9046524.1 phage terminase small subunit P27 family [Acinetobacter nosoc
MSKTGRPPKPLQEKILSGARIRNDRDEDAQVANAAVDLGMPPCPSWVKGAAKKHWEVLGPKLVQAGLLSVVDGDVFGLHCDNIAAYEQVCEKLTKFDDWIAKTPNDFVIQSAWLQIRNKLQELIIKTAREFGLTPAARSNVKINKQQQQDLFGASQSTESENDPYKNFS